MAYGGIGMVLARFRVWSCHILVITVGLLAVDAFFYRTSFRFFFFLFLFFFIFFFFVFFFFLSFFFWFGPPVGFFFGADEMIAEMTAYIMTVEDFNSPRPASQDEAFGG